MADSNPALLTYSYLGNPDPIQASADGSPAYASLTITVQNSTGSPIQCSSIAIGLVVGTNAKDFAANATGINTIAPTGWNAVVSGDSLLMTPVKPADGTLAKASVTFLFTGIQVNTQPGQASLPITEITVQDGVSTKGASALLVDKAPTQFTLGPLTVLSPQSTVVAGNAGVLQWAGGDASYSLTYDPGSGPVTVPDLQQIETFTTVPLEHLGLMGFTLNVSVPIPGTDQPLLLQRQASITVTAPLPVITSFTGTVQGGQADFTWTTENAVSCTLAGSAIQYGSGGSTGLVAIPMGTATLTAYNGDGVASAPAYLQPTWALASEIPVPVDQFEIAVGQDGTEIFVMGNWFGGSPGLLLVMSPDGGTIRQANLGQALNVALFSPDYTRLYIGMTNEIVAVDPVTLSIVATATVANQRELAISPDGTRLYASDFHGAQVSLIDTSTMTVAAQAPYLGANNMGGLAVGHDGLLLFGMDSDNAQCFVWNAETLAFIKTIGVDSAVQGIVASPTLPEVYLTTGPGNNLAVIDTSTLAVVAVIPAGPEPSDMAITSDGSRIFIGADNWQTPTFSIFDTARRVITQTTSVGDEPFIPVFSPADSRFYSTVFSDKMQRYDVSMLTPPG